jgi:preprotein translocase subunit SecB
MRNLEEAQMHAFMFAEAPRILFPFARRVIADATRDAGFTPVMLEPIDFNGCISSSSPRRPKPSTAPRPAMSPPATPDCLPGPLTPKGRAFCPNSLMPI